MAGTSHEDVCTFMITYRPILIRMRNVSEKVVEKIKTHILCSVTVYPKWCRWWNIVELFDITGETTDDNITWRMPFACWIRGYRHKLRVCECNTYWFSTKTMFARTRLDVTFYLHCLSSLFEQRKTCWEKRSKWQYEEDAWLLQIKCCIRMPAPPHNFLTSVGAWTAQCSFTIRQNKTVSVQKMN